MKKIIKNNILFFVIGAIVFGSITFVLATNIESSNVDFVTNKDSNIISIEGALDDLYNYVIGHPEECFNGTCGSLKYLYWNDNFSGTYYTLTASPTGSGSSGSYVKRSLLADNYSDFATRSIYIRSAVIDNNIVGHEVCLYYINENKSICLKDNYWYGTTCDDSSCFDTNSGAQSLIKLKRDIETSLGITIPSYDCDSSSDYAGCFVGKYYISTDSYGGVGIYDCDTNNDGTISCSDNPSKCIVNNYNTAYCMETTS